MSTLQAALERLEQNQMPPLWSKKPATPKAFIRHLHDAVRNLWVTPTSSEDDRLLQTYKNLIREPLASPEKVAPLAALVRENQAWKRNARGYLLNRMSEGITTEADYREFCTLIILVATYTTSHQLCSLYEEVFFVMPTTFLPDFTQLVIQAKLLETNGGIEIFNLSENSNFFGQIAEHPFLQACRKESSWIKSYWYTKTNALNVGLPAHRDALGGYISWLNEPHYSRFNRNEPRKKSSDFEVYQTVINLQPTARQVLFRLIVSASQVNDFKHPVLRDKALWVTGLTWTVPQLTELITALCQRGPGYSLQLPIVIVPLLRKALKERSPDAALLYKVLKEFQQRYTTPYDKRTTLPNLLKLYAHGGMPDIPTERPTVATYDQLKPSGVALNTLGGMNHGTQVMHAIIRNGFMLMGPHYNCGTIKLEQTGLNIQVAYYFGKATGKIEIEDRDISLVLRALNTVFSQEGAGYQLTLLQLNSQAFQSPGGFWNYGYYQLIVVNEATAKAMRQKIDQSALVDFPPQTNPLPASLLNLKEAKRRQLENQQEIDIANNPAFQVLAPIAPEIPQPEAWAKFLGHCQNFPVHGAPVTSWAKETKRLFQKIGVDDFSTGLILVLDKLIPQTEWFKSDRKLNIIRGLTWSCRLHGGSAEIYALQRIGVKAYRKVPGGPLNAKLGNIALESLISIGNFAAYGSMNIMEAKATYSVFKRALASRKKKFKALLKEYTVEELEERSIPQYGFENGIRRVPVGSYTAVFEPKGLKIGLSWESETGKIQKSIPAALKASHAAQVKSLKAEAKNIGETFSAQATRLEATYLSQRSWSFKNWKALYLDHNLMRLLSSTLIWVSRQNSTEVPFTVSDNKLVTASGNEIAPADDAVIRLWHPATATVENTMAWRDYLFHAQIQQPFKQAFREVYLLTPAEENTFDHSMRFAHHYLKGKTLYSLGKTRGWKVGYQEPVYKHLPAADITVSFTVEGEPLFDDVISQQLTFYPGKRYYGRDALPLKDIPSEVLSEVMRDLDLFVAVAGIVIDGHMAANLDADRRAYWQDVVTGRRSNTQQIAVRKDLLLRILPMTKLRTATNIKGNFLHVKGKLKAYNINLGTGHCFIEPQNQYLCIVPARNRSANVWLPFASEDRTLTMILSKAFLLANDDKITDLTILRQLGVR